VERFGSIINQKPENLKSIFFGGEQKVMLDKLPLAIDEWLAESNNKALAEFLEKNKSLLL
jgi:hypothetical protein